MGISLTLALGRPGQKLYARRLFSDIFEREWPRDVILVGTSRIRKTLCKKLSADFSFPKFCECTDRLASLLFAQLKSVICEETRIGRAVA